MFKTSDIPINRHYVMMSTDVLAESAIVIIRLFENSIFINYMYMWCRGGNQGRTGSCGYRVIAGWSVFYIEVLWSQLNMTIWLVLKFSCEFLNIINKMLLSYGLTSYMSKYYVHTSFKEFKRLL